jgi:hypothetical protein
MNNSAAGTAMTPKELHDRNSKLIQGYTAFVAALLFATITKSDNSHPGYVVVCLLVASLPSLVTFVLLDFLVNVMDSKAEIPFRKLALVLGFLPSLLGVALWISQFSLTAGVLFIFLTVFWTVTVYVLARRSSSG